MEKKIFSHDNTKAVAPARGAKGAKGGDCPIAPKCLKR